MTSLPSAGRAWTASQLKLGQVQLALMAATAATCLVSIFAAELLLALAGATFLLRLAVGERHGALDRRDTRAPAHEDLRQVGEPDGAVAVEILRAERARTPGNEKLSQIGETDVVATVEIGWAGAGMCGRRAARERGAESDGREKGA